MFDPKSKILIVDHMPTMRKLMRGVLEGIGFTEIAEAGDGTLGWEAISGASEPFDLVLSEWNMPNCSGIDLLKRIRSDSSYHKTPFILVTAESAPEKITEAVRAGVSSFVVKPFTADALKEKLTVVHQRMKQ